ARAGVVALIAHPAADEVAADAHAALARVRLRAGVAVAARGSVGLGRVRAEERRLRARAGVGALIAHPAAEEVADGAHAALARVRLRAGVAVAAPRPCGLGRVRAEAVRRIAHADVVALIAHPAADEVAAGARAALAGVRLRTGVAVVARGSVGLGRV